MGRNASIGHGTDGDGTLVELPALITGLSIGPVVLERPHPEPAFAVAVFSCIGGGFKASEDVGGALVAKAEVGMKMLSRWVSFA